jgi:hypothetical protein
MLMDTVTFDGAVFALSELEAASLKARCLEAHGDNGYIDFSTSDGQHISMLMRPDSRVYFSSFESGAEISPIATLSAFDTDDYQGFDPDWFEYVA